MRYNELIEAPIDNWEVDPDLDHNEQEMISKFHGYDREQKHWSDIDKKNIKNPVVIKKIKDDFLKVSTNFNLYFWQSTDPDYDETLQQGIVDLAWIKDKLGQNALEYVNRVHNTNAITFIMTGNISDESYVPIKNGWMLAHRLAHSLIGGQQSTESANIITHLFDNFVQTIISEYYDIDWPDHQVIEQDYLEIYGKELGHMLGTMKAARTKNLVNNYEWIYETFVQYLMTGNIKFNSLVNIGPEEQLLPNKNPTKTIQKFRTKLINLFDRLLQESIGKIYVE